MIILKTNFIIYFLILSTQCLIGQSFTFVSKPGKEICGDRLVDKSLFCFILGENEILVSLWGDIVKLKNDSVIAETGNDFGYNYEIHHFGYLIYEDRIYFLFFIQENNVDYAVLYSFSSIDLSKTKRLHFPESYKLIKHDLHGHNLILEFDNRTYNINLNRDLRRERANPIYNQKRWRNRKIVPYYGK